TKEYANEQKGITELGKNNVFFLPYLMGERTPHNNPNARGTFIGMTMDTSRADMTQAVLEGVAFALRDSLEIARSLGVNVTRTRINGGGAKSPLWKKIIANVMNVSVDTINSEEGPAFGAAILAAVGCKEYATVEEAADKLIKVIDTVSPDAELTKLYEDKYQKFIKIYPSVKELYNELI
ncbi:MAG TPA: FGGY-family carbohydrate kinase, partial [Lachnospiraceae bacterium]|nr:FGGY-family carbohydrate kinase [Lachnospiraceae bacterium]